MNLVKTEFSTDVWVNATWADYLKILENPAYEKAKGYYYNGQGRIEMSPVGFNHSEDNGILALFVNLWGMAKGIPMRVQVNCTYRQSGKKECQPDLSYYIGDRVKLSPKGISVVDLDKNLPPDLVIEISATSLADDLGNKRLLYEELGVREYWVVDVQNSQMIAFEMIATNGSQRIWESKLLPGLEMSLLEEGLQRSREADNTEVGNWFLEWVRD
ncbi:Uma2 family endonuclease [Phormidium pseudopriestleyi FRX01]|uniref:Uma2 family endonuclease n=1 Tax=Phormidium pseudopriestleyi FRX01 TaxID=1759528 RepID=A0ABS3FPQ1_9CYAN|nr:Uma2 family endonuclease [Phormidium pseudopriestleyi]MBO0349099.1 Uma2 family endonuclease [Phormidium pseudopriestleyi FRX01]